ncbi:methyltransferase domain-containing protein [Pseudoalteromonas sp. Of7M-16]|uniref:methyltransferase domain-containing protein n=1 Tax=Pseudoalteromonas sp. Of7M-16 TaxID=2917756 RepID=UPI001EF5DB86|nr:methyltransferase domain-containing protein [Pseudoalteromonas sp. Of7M-16]MCG7549602.1 methyltransferase domain-containing protein [Pseudoalteromonas sp. Of7M-16]
MGISKEQFIGFVKTLLRAKKSTVAKAEIKAMVDYLGKVTGVFSSTDMNASEKAQTASGVAISPVQAAKCFEETVRTQIFCQGVAQAIQDKITKNISPVRVLYAGTGPYATLLLPLLAASDNLPLEITLIDIHKENINAVNKLINHFDLEHYNISVNQGDATLWQKPPSQSDFDIVISETMTALLKREPQVYIFKHLVRYLKPCGVMIPEDVSLKAWLTKVEGERQGTQLLGEFFRLDKQTSLALSQGDHGSFKSNLTIPHGDWSGYTVKLTTDIIVYRNLTLTEGDCSLNIAFNFSPYDVVLEQNHPICFEYVAPQSPDFSILFPKAQWQASSYTLPDSSELGKLGLVHLKRTFQRAYMVKRGERFTIAPHEWHAELGLYEMLGLSCAQVSSKMYELENYDEFETWIGAQVGKLSETQTQTINTAFLAKLEALEQN